MSRSIFNITLILLLLVLMVGCTNEPPASSNEPPSSESSVNDGLVKIQEVTVWEIEEYLENHKEVFPGTRFTFEDVKHLMVSPEEIIQYFGEPDHREISDAEDGLVRKNLFFEEKGGASFVEADDDFVLSNITITSSISEAPISKGVRGIQVGDDFMEVIKSFPIEEIDTVENLAGLYGKVGLDEDLNFTMSDDVGYLSFGLRDPSISGMTVKQGEAKVIFSQRHGEVSKIYIGIDLNHYF
ncbi:hypothetical protein PRVXH_000315 [Proteinivorax hydrogeniformans]|uniref:Uncharacterized protein n=1 Tax=Proteinivorax hydrogeniformans TaxID=1826727 RepID=A0AAU8HUF5_9FIRM